MKSELGAEMARLASVFVGTFLGFMLLWVAIDWIVAEMASRGNGAE